MAQIKITGWRRDASKSAADKLLAEAGNLALADARRAIDTVMEGGTVIVTVPSDKLALEISQALRAMNFDARPC